MGTGPAGSRAAPAPSRRGRSVRWPLLVALAASGGLLAIALVVDRMWPHAPFGFPAWYLVFTEGGPIEILQWAALGSCSLIAVWVAAARRVRDARASWFWRLFGIGCLLLLIEDAGNVSHRVRMVVETLFPGVPYGVSRLPVFLLLAILMVVPVVLYRDVVRGDPVVARPLLVGYGFYAVAATASVPFQVVSGYQRVGELLMSLPVGAMFAPLSDEVLDVWGADAMGTIIMDLVVEESLELVAAALLLTASLRALPGFRQDEDDMLLGSSASAVAAGAAAGGSRERGDVT